ncbi:MAG: hypothetical protein WC919_06230 [Candidatus Paceibacterota bacterium]|jgi:hypothetical protein
MIGSKIEELPEDLQTVAKRISTTAECKCDLSVGFICESCVIYALMINAAKEIVKLRGEASEKRKTDRERIAGLPIAHRTSMTYVGRNIYIVEGVKGLYWLRKRLQDEKLPKVSARRQSTRGCSWAESTFVRGRELEELLKPALCE